MISALLPSPLHGCRLAPTRSGLSHDNPHTPDAPIRPLRPEDEADRRQLWTGHLGLSRTERRATEQASTFARRPGDDPRDFTAPAAEVNGRLAGLAHGLFHRHACTIEEGRCLQDRFTSSETRGLGIGRALIEAVDARADVAVAPSAYRPIAGFTATARRPGDRAGRVTPCIRDTRKT